MENENSQSAPADTGGSASGGSIPGQSVVSPEVQALDAKIKAVESRPEYMSSLSPKSHRIAVEQALEFRTQRRQLIDGPGGQAEKVEADAKALIAQQQNTLQSAALTELAALNKLGFEGKIPADVQPFHVESWKQQRFCAEQNFTELAPLMAADFEATGAGSNASGLFNAFLSDDSFDSSLKSKISELIIEHNFKLKQSAYKAAKKGK